MKQLNDDLNLNATYQLIDSGSGRKLERFGSFLIVRPCPQALWNPSLSDQEWKQANAVFSREGNAKWIEEAGTLPHSWMLNVAGLTFKISPTDFGHLGIFPEQCQFWKWIQQKIQKAIAEGRTAINVLNLFAYSGGSTLAAAKAGARVCHVDASKGMVSWARENASLSGLSDAPIRWIIDDVNKFLTRELKRNVHYDAIILDPPSFGRGTKGEVFKIEDDLSSILSSCKRLLSKDPLFLLFSCHSPGFSPIVMRRLLSQLMASCGGSLDEGEMVLEGIEALPLPSGVYARWQSE